MAGRVFTAFSFRMERPLKLCTWLFNSMYHGQTPCFTLSLHHDVGYVFVADPKYHFKVEHDQDSAFRSCPKTDNIFGANVNFLNSRLEPMLIEMEGLPRDLDDRCVQSGHVINSC